MPANGAIGQHQKARAPMLKSERSHRSSIKALERVGTPSMAPVADQTHLTPTSGPTERHRPRSPGDEARHGSRQARDPTNLRQAPAVDPVGGDGARVRERIKRLPRRAEHHVDGVARRRLRRRDARLQREPPRGAHPTGRPSAA